MQTVKRPDSNHVTVSPGSTPGSVTTPPLAPGAPLAPLDMQTRAARFSPNIFCGSILAPASSCTPSSPEPNEKGLRASFNSDLEPLDIDAWSDSEDSYTCDPFFVYVRDGVSLDKWPQLTDWVPFGTHPEGRLFIVSIPSDLLDSLENDPDIRIEHERATLGLV